MELLLQFLLVLTFLPMSTMSTSNNDYFTLPSNYDKSVIPGQVLAFPLEVTASMNLRSIFEINEVKQTITLETTLRFSWKEDRINVNQSALNTKGFVRLQEGDMKKLWIPDIVVDKTKEIRKPQFIKKTESLRLYSDQTILFSARKNYDLACGMDFHRFPFDNQTCDLIIHSYGSSTKDYSLRWGRQMTKDRTINPRILGNLPQFTLETEFIDNWDLLNYDISAYPGLILKLRFVRMLTYYNLQLFIPSGLFVLLAWATMFFPSTTPGIRAQYNVQITNLINIYTLNNGIQTIVPKTSYMTYAQYWIQGCFVFIFLMITELVIFCGLKIRGVDAWADRLNTRSREVVPLLFLLFVSTFFLVATNTIPVD